jgi:cell division protein FtsB
MSEWDTLKEARRLIAGNKIDEATPLLWRLYSSTNSAIKLDAILILIGILNAVTQNDKLLEIVDAGITTAESMGKTDIRGFLLARKSIFLRSQLGLLIYRQKNLLLSAYVFRWINFSTEREKKEYEAISKKREELEKEITELQNTVLELARSSTNNYFKGHIYTAIADLYSSKLFHDQVDFIRGGRMRNIIGNIHFIKRWKLGKWFLYRSKDRKTIMIDQGESIRFYKLAISEFKTGKYITELAQAYYNLAAKFKITYCFKRSTKYLRLAEGLAKKINDQRLLSQILLLRKGIADKNRNIRNYVEELGLDLP